MFLIERLIGVFIYVFILLFTCLFMIRVNVKIKTIFKVYTIVLCVMAYFYTPYETADLYRIFNMVKYFATVNFADFLEMQVAQSSTPIAELFYWLFAQIGNVHLLSAFASYIVYSLLFSVVEKMHVRFSISRLNTAITVFFLMSTSIYMSTIGGIRMMIAMALIIHCFYREAIEHKFSFWHIVLYIIAFFMHNVAVVLIGVRLISMLFKRNTTFIKRALSVVLITTATIFAAVEMNLVVSDTFNKAMDFITGDSYYDVWEYIIGVIFIILFLVIIKNYSDLNRNTGEFGTYNICLKLSIVIALAFCFEFSIFYRFIGHFAPLLALPSMMIVLENCGEFKGGIRRQIPLQIVILALSAVALVINCARGSLSALKFFEL